MDIINRGYINDSEAKAVDPRIKDRYVTSNNDRRPRGGGAVSDRK